MAAGQTPCQKYWPTLLPMIEVGGCSCCIHQLHRWCISSILGLFMRQNCAASSVWGVHLLAGGEAGRYLGRHAPPAPRRRGPRLQDVQRQRGLLHQGDLASGRLRGRRRAGGALRRRDRFGPLYISGINVEQAWRRGAVALCRRAAVPPWRPAAVALRMLCHQKSGQLASCSCPLHCILVDLLALCKLVHQP